MNAIASGVMASAAMIRSPSFSRSASSTTITSSPRAMAATAFSISVKGISVLLFDGRLRCVIPPSGHDFAASHAGVRGEEAFDVLGEHVRFEVDGIAGLLGAQRGDGQRVRDDGDLERAGPVIESGDGEA